MIREVIGFWIYAVITTLITGIIVSCCFPCTIYSEYLYEYAKLFAFAGYANTAWVYIRKENK